MCKDCQNSDFTSFTKLRIQLFLLYAQTHCGITSYLICFKSAPYHTTMVKTVRKLVKKEEKLDDVGFFNGENLCH